MDVPSRTGPPAPISRRTLLRLAAAGTATLAMPALPALAAPQSPSRAPGAPAGADDCRSVLPWFQMAQHLARSTPGYSPPVAARAFGYAGVALYEALVPGMLRHPSLAGQLTGLAPLDDREPAGLPLHWPLVANHTMAAILRLLFPTAEPAHREAIDALERTMARIVGRDAAPPVAQRSRRHAYAVADGIHAWSRDDGGHDAHLRGPGDFVPPAGPGLWRPTPPAFAPALLPAWGRNRTFVPGVVTAQPLPPLPYSDQPGSAFYREAEEVYATVNGLTPAQRDIAVFWSDAPGETATPAGHWVAILTATLRDRRARLDVAAEAYARLGIAVADAFVCCWATKYRYDVLRPITYIRDHIDGGWGAAMPVVTPPFPEYTSGHSVQSAAAASVLTDLLGSRPFVDHTHDDRGLAPRAFSSFRAAAGEAAVSRLYGGIHFRRAIAEGLGQGDRVGAAVNALTWRTSPA